MTATIRLTLGDLTLQQTDAIVNAANSSLLGGGGVDGAIHRAAGPGLLQACRLLNGCPTGEARITPGFNLPAKWVIHTVGPVWVGGSAGEEALLADCYRNSLSLGVACQLKTIAFPSISTGVYRFPKQRAAEIAIHVVQTFLEKPGTLEEVLFVAFDRENYQIYQALLKKPIQ